MAANDARDYSALTPLERARRVKEDVERELLSLPGVTGVGVGYKYVGGKKTDQVAIIVHVKRKPRDVPAAALVPKTIRGVPTDVVERRFLPRALDLAPGPLKVPVTHLQPLVDANRYQTLKGGISGGPCGAVNGDASAGTFGAVVLDNATGEPMLLTNFHVLAPEGQFTIGDTVVQPARPDGGKCPTDVVATLARLVLGGRVDAAAARITERDHACEIVDIGRVAGIAAATLDMKVRKRGRTTGLTSGVVSAIDLTTTTPFPGIGDITLTHQIEIVAGAPALIVAPGFFVPVNWTTAPLTLAGDVTVERDAVGPNPGITVTGTTGSLFHATVGSNVSRYMVFGADNNVLILESTTAAGPVTHRVTLVDFTTSQPSERLILTGSASSASVQLPVVQHSQDAGTVFLIYSSSGTHIQNLAMVRSKDAAFVCPGPPPFIPTGETRGEATTTHLIIHYSSGGMSKQVPCSLAPGGTDDTFGLSGDSGAVVVDEARRIVGLFFASNEAITDDAGNVLVKEGAIAQANPIAAVLEALSVRVCESGDGGGAVPPPSGGSGRLTLSVRDLAERCLNKPLPLSVRQHVFENAGTGTLSLRARLHQIRAQCGAV
jgi:hypothetical protein